MGRVQTGLERFIAAPPKQLIGSRIGILCNPASIDRKYRHVRHQINRLFPNQVTALFSPQHGFYAEKQDNMIESDHEIDPVLQVPIFSLYGETRKPLKEMFDHIDTLIVDLQDVGTRVYTFVYTMAYCLEAAKQFGKKVLVLDRPNPINGVMVEGNRLTSDSVSFVGRYPIPMRHGLTIGEISLMVNDYFGVNCDLEVIAMSGWDRAMFFQDTGLPWVPPSPNLPTPVSAMVYPGQVVWEGTNVSEGRGTTQPFELFGAPYINTSEMIALLDDDSISGVVLRAVVFEPTSNKWKGVPCNGFQIHIIDPFEYKPYMTTLKLLRSIIFLYRDSFEWKMPPYEYEYERLPADLIIGDTEIRRRIENLDAVDEIAKSWTDDLEAYLKTAREFYLYSAR